MSNVPSSMTFRDCSGPSFTTLKREGARYIENVPPSDLIALKYTRLRPLIIAFNGGEKEAARFKQWCRAHEPRLQSGEIDDIVLTLIPESFNPNAVKENEQELLELYRWLEETGALPSQHTATLEHAPADE